MSEGTDFHVGMLRGYLLAMNAPTQIMHSVERILEGHRSKAGPMIGDAAPEPKPVPMPHHPIVSPKRAVYHPPAPKADEIEATFRDKRVTWTTEMVETLKTEFKKGSSYADIAAKLQIKIAKVYNKVCLMKKSGEL